MGVQVQVQVLVQGAAHRHGAGQCLRRSGWVVPVHKARVGGTCGERDELFRPSLLMGIVGLGGLLTGLGESASAQLRVSAGRA